MNLIKEVKKSHYLKKYDENKKKTAGNKSKQKKFNIKKLIKLQLNKFKEIKSLFKQKISIENVISFFVYIHGEIS